MMGTISNKIFICIIAVLFFSMNGMSQEKHWELKYVGLGWHPSDEAMNAEEMPLKLDSEGKYMFNIGLTGSYEWFSAKKPKWSIEAMGAYYYDCAMLYNVVASIGFRGQFFRFGNHSLNGGFGPTILLRRNWHSKLENYVNSGYFNGEEYNYFQWRFYWYGGDLEYNYHFNENSMLSVSFIPGFPKYVALFIGYERCIGCAKEE